MKRKTIKYRAFQEFPFWKGPWRNYPDEAREDAVYHSNCATVQRVELGSPVKIITV